MMVFRSFYENLKILAIADESTWNSTKDKKAIQLAQNMLVEERFLKIFDTLYDYKRERASDNYKRIMKKC